MQHDKYKCRLIVLSFLTCTMHFNPIFSDLLLISALNRLQITSVIAYIRLGILGNYHHISPGSSFKTIKHKLLSKLA